jgi:CRP-like cAMP-binding protein
MEPFFGINPSNPDVNAITLISVKRHEVLFEKGAVSDRLLSIISGQAILTVPETGKVVEILDAGAFFGEEALFQIPRIFSASMTIGGKVAALDPAKVGEKSTLMRKALFNLYDRQERLVEDISSLKSMPPLQRLAKLILTIPQVTRGERSVKLPWRKNLMAERIGVRIETFSRLLPTLKEHGAEVNGDRLVISNYAALSSFVSGSPGEWRLRKPSNKGVSC